jgi:hypothetical protein
VWRTAAPQPYYGSLLNLFHNGFPALWGGRKCKNPLSAGKQAPAKHCYNLNLASCLPPSLATLHLRNGCQLSYFSITLYLFWEYNVIGIFASSIADLMTDDNPPELEKNEDIIVRTMETSLEYKHVVFRKP